MAKPEPHAAPAKELRILEIVQEMRELVNRSCEAAERFLNYLLTVSWLQEVFFLWRPILPDPDDDMILEVAAAAQCRYIVTHNVADFRGSERFGIAALPPGVFLRQIEQSS